jgi:hypothetical protein
MTIPDTVILVIYTLAAARVTGLITTDTITEEIRDNLIGWLDDRPKTLGRYLATLITCPWCAGMWVSLIAAPLLWFAGHSPYLLVPALALAISQIIGMIASVGR